MIQIHHRKENQSPFQSIPNYVSQKQSTIKIEFKLVDIKFLMCKNADEEVDGGTVSVLVKYSDIITVIKKTFSICRLTAAVLKSCPIEEGNHKIVITETFPSYAPSVRK